MEVAVFVTSEDESKYIIYQFPRDWLKKAGKLFSLLESKDRVELKTVSENIFSYFIHWLISGKFWEDQHSEDLKTLRTLACLSRLSRMLMNPELYNAVLTDMMSIMPELKRPICFKSCAHILDKEQEYCFEDDTMEHLIATYFAFRIYHNIDGELSNEVYENVNFICPLVFRKLAQFGRTGGKRKEEVSMSKKMKKRSK